MEDRNLEEMIRAACVLEAAARKPGNVHPLRSFPDLTYRDFVLSAEAIAPILARTAELPHWQDHVTRLSPSRLIAPARPFRSWQHGPIIRSNVIWTYGRQTGRLPQAFCWVDQINGQGVYTTKWRAGIPKSCATDRDPSAGSSLTPGSRQSWSVRSRQTSSLIQFVSCTAVGSDPGVLLQANPRARPPSRHIREDHFVPFPQALADFDHVD